MITPLTSEAKITLFRSIFKGRTDVFAQYWVSHDGKKQGWFPVHTDRSNKVFAPLTDAVIEAHLRGNRTIGVYPLLTGNKSSFIVADFDGVNWQKEVSALLAVCKEWHLPCYVERSRSGGAHMWWFFEAPYAAARSRVIFLHLLKLANSIDPLDGEKSFDRLLPSQDYLSGKGLGNLIALPLQGTARQQGNTVFLDPEKNFEPLADQWDILQSIERISLTRLDELYTISVEQKKTETQVTHYTGPNLPITVGAHIVIPKALMIKELANFLGEHLNFFNTEYAVKQRMGLSTFGTERYFRTIEKDDETVKLPRGFLSQFKYSEEKNWAGHWCQKESTIANNGRDGTKFGSASVT